MTVGDTVPVRGTTARGDRRRRQILDVAYSLFGERGFNSVSLADIAARAELTQAGVLHHYPTKAALLIAVLQDRETRNEERDAERLEQGMGWIDSFLETLEENEQHPELVQLFAVLSAESLSAQHPGHDWWVQRYAATVQRAARQLAREVDPGALPDGVDHETVARWLIALADGLRMQALLAPGTVDRHELVASFARVLLRPGAPEAER